MKKDNNQFSSNVVLLGLISLVNVIAITRGAGMVVVYSSVIFLAVFLLGNFISKKFKDNKIITVIMWSNLISWLFPLAGLTTIAFSYGALEKVHKNNKWKYTVLTVIGSLLTVGSFLFTLLS